MEFYPGVNDQGQGHCCTKKENAFMLNNLSFIWTNDARPNLWVPYTNMQLRIATQMSVIKVKVTVAKKRISVSAQQLEFSLAK